MFFFTPQSISVTFQLLVTPHVHLNKDNSPLPVFFRQLLKSLLPHFGVDVAYGYSL
jgi:hypothetical protein